MTVRRSLLLIVLSALMMLPASTDSASARLDEVDIGTTEVSAMPGFVSVRVGTDEPHRIVLEESVELNPSWWSVFGVGALTAVQRARVGAVAAGGTVAGGPEAGGLLAAIVALSLVLSSGKEDKSEPERVLVVTDFSGQPIVSPPTVDGTPSCRSEPRAVVGNKLVDSVKCPLTPDPQFHSAPELHVVGGSSSDDAGTGVGDEIELRFQCELCLSRRMVHAGDGDDKVIGSPFTDILQGLPGNDTLKGMGGDDYLLGGDGHTYLQAAVGDHNDFDFDDDRLFGGDGADVIIGYGGNDLIAGGPGDDRRTYHMTQQGEDHDSRLPLEANLALSGGAGNDVLIGGPGRDKMEGGPDRDTILARESDYGKPEERDDLIDCGPNYMRPQTRPEYFRASSVDPPPIACNTGLVAPIPHTALITLPSGLDWPWYQ